MTTKPMEWKEALEIVLDFASRKRLLTSHDNASIIGEALAVLRAADLAPRNQTIEGCAMELEGAFYECETLIAFLRRLKTKETT